MYTETIIFSNTVPEINSVPNINPKFLKKIIINDYMQIVLKHTLEISFTKKNIELQKALVSKT